MFLTAAGITNIMWKENAAIAQHGHMEQDTKGAGQTETPATGESKTAGHEHPMGHMKAHGQTELKPAEGASVKLLSPKPEQEFIGDEVPIRYRFVKGKRGSHLHAYVDGELMGMFSHPEKGTLTGIRPGRHILEIRVATKDHQTELDASDRVYFVVK